MRFEFNNFGVVYNLMSVTNISCYLLILKIIHLTSFDNVLIKVIRLSSWVIDLK